MAVRVRVLAGGHPQVTARLTVVGFIGYYARGRESSMKKILMVAAVVAIASVSAWLLRGWLANLARLAAQSSKPAAALRDADPSRQPTTDASVQESFDMNANRVGSR